MPLNVGDTGYGSVADPGSASGAAGSSETAALLVPEFGEEGQQEWRPMSKEELEESAGGPGWRRVRCYLVVLFWLAWLAMLAISVAIIVTSPRPVATPLTWWQKSVFLQLQSDLFAGTPSESSGAVDVLCDQLPYLKSLGISALILKGLFDSSNTTESGERSGTLPQVQRLLGATENAGLKVVLDVCDVQLFGAREDLESQVAWNATQRALRFWLGQGVAGFSMCDTDASYTEKSLMLWKGVLEEFSEKDEERIVVVNQTQEHLPPLVVSGQQLNVTLVDVVLRSVLPDSPRLLSARQVADAIETHLQTPKDTWLGWMVGGKASYDLRRLLLVLLMTLPGTPVVQYDQLYPAQGENGSEFSDFTDKYKLRHSNVALFRSLSHNRAREEALVFGSFTFLPFNTSSNATLSSHSSSPPLLAFLRSWGCVHFLVLLNVGSEPLGLDPTWAPSLPEAGVFVASTALHRLGAVNLDTLVLQPCEAVVVKLFEPGSYS
ncbi:4F2 cell-surface antigen heavy chain [Hippocampus zosterae]|uniref:4F2 cell-surface antigen heavy chain n=1 Tax=Hippocampus zosterae TaxID=109293 RepID=UPI00223E35A2|nr:4F2 cell-surface antigen heavy chain [Hippocampus zosterae]